MFYLLLKGTILNDLLLIIHQKHHMKIHFSHWTQWSLNFISICKLVSILFAMLQQFSEPGILNPEELSNSLLCFFEMSMCLLSSGNNLLTSFNLCTDVRELGSGDWQASWSPTECPCATSLSPGPGPLPFWASGCPGLPQTHWCRREAAQPPCSPLL